MDNPLGIVSKINTVSPYQCYKHSKDINLLSLFIFLILSTVGTFLLSIIYSYALHYISVGFLNVVSTALFGYFAGLFVGVSGEVAKVKNPTIITIFGVVFGLFAIYSSWVVWLFESSHRQVWIFNPIDILEIMRFSSIKSMQNPNFSAPTGFLLHSTWLAEAISIFVVFVYVSSTHIKNRVFCEKCNIWLDDEYIASYLNYPYNHGQLRNLLYQGQFSALSDLEIYKPGNDSFTKVKLSKCSDCNELYLLTVDAIKIIKKPDKNSRIHKTTIVQNMIIDSEIYHSIKFWTEREVVLKYSRFL